MSRFSRREDTESFADAVDGRGRPAPEHARLLTVVGALREAPEPPTRPGVAEDLRARLVAEAAQVLRPGNARLALPERPRGRRERRLVAAAAAVIVVGGTAGMATASQNALPGDALYPVKRGLEQVQVDLAPGDAGKGHDLLNQAGDRLDEAARLIGRDPSASDAGVQQALGAFTAQARQGSGMLLASYRDTRDPASVAEVRRFATTSLVRLEALGAAAPGAAQDQLRTALRAVRTIDRQAAAACPICGGAPRLHIPSLFLASTEAARALRDVRGHRLDNSHPLIGAPPTTSAGGAGSGAAGGSGSGGGTTSGATGSTGGSTTAPATGGLGGLGGTVGGTVDGVAPDLGTVLKDPGTLTEQLQKTVDGVTGTLLPGTTSGSSSTSGVGLLP